MNKTPTDRLLASRQGKGFALIVALVLMSFVVLLIVSLSSLVKVETQLSTTRSEYSRAQNNALLGLYSAMGELQKMAGPDQRVTGTAELVDGMSEPLHAHWTGVWDVSGRDPHAAFVAPSQEGWLVSGKDAAGDPITPGGTVEDPIIMLGAASVDNPDDQVQVGRVGIDAFGTGDVSGHYAYWVSDEGVKAKVNLKDPHRDAPSGDNTQKRYSLMSAQRFGIESISTEAASDTQNTFGDAIDPLSSSTSEDLTRLSTLSQMSIIDGSLDDALQHRYHDLTTYSWGLLTNTASGGLKKDLSLAFEMDISDFNSNAVFAGYESIRNLSGVQVNYLFKFDDYNAPLPAAANPMTRGPTWHLLRSYYRLYKSDDVDRLQSYKLGNPGGVQASGGGYKIEARPHFPVLPASDSLQDAYFYTGSDPEVRSQYTTGSGVDRDLARETDMPINPIVLREQYFMNLLVVEDSPADPATGTPGSYRLELRVSPVITLWNPYNVQLEFESMEVKLIDTQISAKIDADSRQIDVDNLLNKKSIVLTLTANGGGATTLDPGEMVMYAMTSTQNFANNTVTSACQPYSGTSASLPGILFPSLDNGSDLVVPGSSEVDITITADSHVQSVISLGRTIGGTSRLRELHGGWLDIEGNGRWESELPISTLLAAGATSQSFSFAVLDLYLKPMYDDNPVQFLTHYNPRATMFRRSTGIAGKAPLGEDTANPGNWGFQATMLSSSNNTALPSSGHWGDSFETGASRVVLYEIPTLPLQSLAQLQHVNNVTHYAQSPAYVIGNSYASPFIGPTALSRTISASDVNGTKYYTQIDWSYLSNEALWDEYFFSTLAPRQDLGLDDSNWSGIVNGFADGTYELSNSRIKLITGVDADDFASTVLTDPAGNTIAPDAYAQVAGSLYVDGAFNVNSTSVEAWKALLSATNGVDVSHLNTSGSSIQTSTTSAGDSPFTRLGLPADGEGADWAGYRELNEREIQDLAEAIVEQVKMRGPFVSLSDFVNRRLSNDSDDTGRMGALQAAIEDAGLNSGFSTTVNSSDLSQSNLTYTDHAMGPIASGATGYLRQSDLLQTIAPALSARSDTFVIRAYGDSVSPLTGETVTAWCEAVVQRVPEYVNSGNTVDADTASLNPTNAQYGRRFEIVAFRWLTDDQI